MLVKLLLVAEVEVPDNADDPEDAAMERVEELEGKLEDISFWQPAIGGTVDRGGCKSVEVFY